MGAVAGGIGLLVYGALVEAKRLVLERRTLRLPDWPPRLNGLRIAHISDLHLRDEYSLELAVRAAQMVADEQPDVVAITGDFVGYWKAESPWLIEQALAPLVGTNAPILAVPGNHDHFFDGVRYLRPILDELGVRLLQNECVAECGVQWVGVDSANMHRADVSVAFVDARADFPTIVLWHEPDLVDRLPRRCALMLAGHSHGGQFLAPWGWAPMTTVNGRRYRRGFYPDAGTPLYVSRGIGTTGPPSRLFCPPEVAILTLERQPNPDRVFARTESEVVAGLVERQVSRTSQVQPIQYWSPGRLKDEDRVADRATRFAS